jgi:hypothetical protein
LPEKGRYCQKKEDTARKRKILPEKVKFLIFCYKISFQKGWLTRETCTIIESCSLLRKISSVSGKRRPNLFDRIGGANFFVGVDKKSFSTFFLSLSNPSPSFDFLGQFHQNIKSSFYAATLAPKNYIPKM